MSKIQENIPAADTRVFAGAIRKALKATGLPWKVKGKNVSFSGFGYGNAPFATIATERALEGNEARAIAMAIRSVIEMPEENGGGKGIVQLEGPTYPFGGSIHHTDYPTEIKRTTSENIQARKEEWDNLPKKPMPAAHYLGVTNADYAQWLETGILPAAG